MLGPTPNSCASGAPGEPEPAPVLDEGVTEVTPDDGATGVTEADAGDEVSVTPGSEVGDEVGDNKVGGAVEVLGALDCLAAGATFVHHSA